MRRFTYNHAPLAIFFAILISMILEMIMSQFINPERSYLMMIVVSIHMFLIYFPFKMSYNPQMLNYLKSINITKEEILKGIISSYIYATVIQLVLSLMFSLIVPNVYILAYKALFMLSLLVPFMYITVDPTPINFLIPLIVMVTYNVNLIVFLSVNVPISIILFYKLKNKILKEDLI